MEAGFKLIVRLTEEPDLPGTDNGGGVIVYIRLSPAKIDSSHGHSEFYEHPSILAGGKNIDAKKSWLGLPQGQSY